MYGAASSGFKKDHASENFLLTEIARKSTFPSRPERGPAPLATSGGSELLFDNLCVGGEVGGEPCGLIAQAAPADLALRSRGRVRVVSVFSILYGEFDPGSERTLAAWIRHASRTRKGGLAPLSRVAHG